MNKVKVSIVIPNRNGKNFLQNLIPTIINQTYKNYEIIMVDNNSTDKTVVPFILENYPQIKVLINEKNMGCAYSFNRGIRSSQGEYVCLLNNDTLLKENYLEEHVKTLDSHPEIGILGCKIMDNDNNIQSSGAVLSTGFPADLTDDFSEMRESESVGYAAVFVRKNIFEKAGYFSLDYFMKYEDCDFTEKARRKLDFKVCILPQPLVTHLGRSNSMSCDLNAFYRCRSLIIFQKKYYPKCIWKNIFYVTPKEFLAILLNWLKNPKTIKPTFSMILAGVAGTISGLAFSPKKHTLIL